LFCISHLTAGSLFSDFHTGSVIRDPHLLASSSSLCFYICTLRHDMDRSRKSPVPDIELGRPASAAMTVSGALAGRDHHWIPNLKSQIPTHESKIPGIITQIIGSNACRADVNQRSICLVTCSHNSRRRVSLAFSSRDF
jgi:hypothetical protein